MSNKIRTTIEPDRVIEVSDEELLDLTRQGLVHNTKAEKATPIKKAE